MTYKLLFVCLGNICRSPSAENIMNHLIEQRGLTKTIICDSAGTAGYHIGAAPDRRMSAAAENKLGFKLRGQARQFQILDFQEFDLILAMDRSNYDDILAVDRSGKYHSKVRLMCDFCSKYTLNEVPDPYYGGVEGFNQVIDLLMDACEGLLADITQKLVL
jgi:protein-tyrosine phosphatase